MRREQFELLKEKANKMEKLVLGELGCHNVNVLKHRINSGDETKFRWAYEEFDYEGNYFKPVEEAEEYIIDLLRCNALTDDEWDKILPHISFYEFNEDLNDIIKQLMPYVEKTKKYGWIADLELEFWQGGLSGGSHWCNPNGDNINSKENGKTYTKTIKSMSKIIEPFREKWGYCGVNTIERLLEGKETELTFSWY